MNRQPIICFFLLLVTLAVIAGCSNTKQISRFYDNPYPQPKTVAVAVFTNMSGVDTLDVLTVTDEFYAELQQVQGINVIPIDRVLRALNVLEINTVNSQQDAMELAEHLNADAVIVGSVTQYDPYDPPRVAMIVQLYDRDSRLTANQPSQQPIDPVSLSRQPTTFVMNSVRQTESTTTIARVFDCDQDDVVERVKQYAQDRAGRQSPAGWRYYIRSRTYLSFVSHEIIGELLHLEKQRMQRLYEEQLRLRYQNALESGERGEM